MAQENIKIELPVSGLACEIKSYLTHKVARKTQRVFVGDMEIDPHKSKEQIMGSLKLTGEQALEFSDILVKGLLNKIGDKTRENGMLTDEVIDDLAEDDFNAIAEKATEVYNASQKKSDPKE